MLDLRYDPESRSGFVRLREGRTARTRRLSSQAMADYGRRGELLAITLEDLDPTAAEFLRTSDEDSLLAVIRAQTGRPVWTTPPAETPHAKKPRPPAKQKRRR
jgi:hypothetical protein